MLKYAKYLFLLIYIFGVFIISYEALKDGNESSNTSNNVADIVGGAVDQIGGVVDQIGGVIGGGSHGGNSSSNEQPGQGNEQPGQGNEQPGQGNEQPGQGNEQPGQGNEQPGQGSEQPGQGNEQPGQGNEQPGQGDEQPGENDQDPEQNEDEPHEHKYVDGNCECGEKDPNFITRYNFDIKKFRYLIRKLVGHFGAFVILGIFACLTYYCFINKNKLIALLVTIGAGIIVAAGSELLQFIPDGRYPTFKDVLIDMGGYMCATLVFSLIFYLPYFIKKLINKRKVESN